MAILFLTNEYKVLGSNTKHVLGIDTRVGHLLILKMSDRSFFEQKISELDNRSFFAHFCSFTVF